MRELIFLFSQIDIGPFELWSMTDIRCPSCNAVFEMDASGYAEIVTQIKGEEFEKELDKRL